MIQEAKDFEEEDRMLKERVDSRNGLESYLYGLKNSLNEEAAEEALPAEDRKELLDLIDETLDWMEDNSEASKDDMDDRKKEVEQIAGPIIRQMYAGGTSQNDEDMDGFYDSDLWVPLR